MLARLWTDGRHIWLHIFLWGAPGQIVEEAKALDQSWIWSTSLSLHNGARISVRLLSSPQYYVALYIVLRRTASFLGSFDPVSVDVR